MLGTAESRIIVCGSKITVVLLVRAGYRPSALTAFHQPGLNAEERIWRQARYDATTNRYFETLDDVWEAVRSRTRRWSPSMVRRLCHIS